MDDLKVILPNYNQIDSIDRNISNFSSMLASKNLFNVAEIKLGVLSLSGVEPTTINSSWCYSGYIPVFGSTSYIFSSFHTSTSTGVCFFDESMIFISSQDGSVVSGNGNIVTTPSNCRYVRFCILYQNRNTTQFQIGAVTTDYEAYSVVNPTQLLTDLLTNRSYILTKEQSYSSDLYPGYIDSVDFGYMKFYKNTDTTQRISAALEVREKEVAVKYNSSTNTLSFSETGINGDYTNTVVFNSTNFPALIDSSVIQKIYLLPWTRNSTTTQTGKDWRCVIITKFGQIYHNFPKRDDTTDGTEVAGDMLKFEESVVWDLPGRRYPTNTNEVTNNYRYIPGLPADDYKLYPMANTDVNFVDTYGNGGFPDTLTVGSDVLSRFYEANRASDLNSFSPMGGFTVDSKICLLGTYRSNTTYSDRCRICLFATDDGGRTWFNKYEFTSDNAVANYGVNINTSSLSNSYNSGELVCQKRILSIPSTENKMPTNIYSLGDAKTITVLSKGSETLITTSSSHGYTSGDVIALIKPENSTLNAEFDFLINQTAGNFTGGNGIFWKVEVVNSTQFKLRHFIHNPYNNLPCRHIHAITKLKDGYIIGTGERYPEGWILYLSVKHSDTFTIKTASSAFSITRLTSTNTAIQRTLGTLLLDDADNTVIFAADDETLTRNALVVTGRSDITVTRSSTGVFKGKLSDIDDFSNFVNILDSREVCYFFKEIKGFWIFCGQRGELAVSRDKGATWSKGRIYPEIQQFRGETNKEIVLGDYIILVDTTK